MPLIDYNLTFGEPDRIDVDEEHRHPHSHQHWRNELSRRCVQAGRPRRGAGCPSISRNGRGDADRSRLEEVKKEKAAEMAYRSWIVKVVARAGRGARQCGYGRTAMKGNV